MSVSRFGAVALCLLATACGGGGGGSAPIVIPPTTVTPTPTPSPTPSPTPTPADYSAFDFSRSLTLSPDNVVDLRTLAVCVPGAPPPCAFNSGSVTQDDRPTTTFGWNPTTSDFTISGSPTETFLGTEKVAYPGGYPLVYLKLANSMSAGIRTDVQTMFSLRHVWQEQHFHVLEIDETTIRRNADSSTKDVARHYRQYLLGRRTAPADIPGTGAVRLNAGFTSWLSMEDGLWGVGWEAPVQVDIDFAARTIRTAHDAVSVSRPAGTAPLRVKLTLDARFDPVTGRITGTLRSDDGDYAGTVAGYFYGPAAAEIGLSVSMTTQAGVRPLAGVIAGWR